MSATTPHRYPTTWQRKTMWRAVSALCVVLLIVIVASSIWIAANVISFLQPILIPVAIAGILAYLLDPLVTKLTQRGLGRTWSVTLLFTAALIVIVLLFSWIVPMISEQSASFAKELPNYTQRARDRIVDLAVHYNRFLGVPTGPRAKSASPSKGIVDWLLGSPAPHATATAPPSEQATATASPAVESPTTPPETIAPATPKLTTADRQRIQAYVEKQMPNVERYLPTLAEKFWNLLKTSIGGFLGLTGFLLSLILVPIYLFFFLKERPRIEARWKEYLPLRDSPLKVEVAEVITQINHYVIAYFRGQLLVCLVDGCLIGSILTIYPGLSFAPLIGMMVVVLTMIPYIGIVICWVPAVLIAAFQFGDWTHPLIVTAIFIIVQNLEGMFYAPRIIGDSVGLHPLTVIVSIFVWGLLIGGLLGPILAVPLTATIKVLLARYVWGRRLRERVMEQVEHVPVVEDST